MSARVSAFMKTGVKMMKSLVICILFWCQLCEHPRCRVSVLISGNKSK